MTIDFDISFICGFCKHQQFISTGPFKCFSCNKNFYLRINAEVFEINFEKEEKNG